METTTRATPITGKEGTEIELAVAAEWTKNHRDRHPHNSISQFFGHEVIQKLLDQPGCLGIRVYYANSHKLNGWQKCILSISNFLKKSVAGAVGEDHIILVGATAEGIDMLPTDKKINTSYMKMSATTDSSGSDGSTSSGSVVEQAHPCPGSAGCPKNALTGD